MTFMAILISDPILDLDITELTLEELVNVECNVTADKALVHGVEGKDFPEEDLVLLIGDWRVSGALAPSIVNCQTQAREHYDTVDIIPRTI